MSHFFDRFCGSNEERKVIAMINQLLPTLFTDPQAKKPLAFCPSCGAELYAPGAVCPFCGRETS